MCLLSRRIEDYLKGQVRCGMLEEIIMRPLMELVLFNLQRRRRKRTVGYFKYLRDMHK
jgi:hypothetical protein